MVNLFKYYCFVILLFLRTPIFSQNYHALHGSSLSGSLGVANNPSSIVNTPYKWDITLLSGQLKYSTNIVTIFKYSLLSTATRSEYLINSGIFNRYGTMNFNFRLLNARFSINEKHALAAGINVRGYTRISPSDYHFYDTVQNVKGFLRINNPATIYNLDITHSSWIEAFASYSRTVFETGTGRLNLGITVKAMRGISGMFGQMQGASASFAAGDQLYLLTSGTARYGYSSNYDTWKSTRSNSDNLRNFLTHTQGGMSADFGAEYLVKSGSIATFNDPDDFYGYEWKIGLSLLDVGKNNFKYGVYSREFSETRPNVSDEVLQQKFNSIHSVPALADSISGIVKNTKILAGNFSITMPARIVLNVDRYLLDHFYLNGELSMNLGQVGGKKMLQANEFNLLAITPRWETQRWGFYLPVLYNTRNRAWAGGAIKAGPLLLGIHNWGNIFSTKKMQRGGGYLAILLHPGNFPERPTDKRYRCPDIF